MFRRLPQEAFAFDTTTLSSAGSSPLTAVNLHLLKSLWLPDVEILNLKTFETLTVLSKLEGIWIDHELNLVRCAKILTTSFKKKITKLFCDHG